MSYISELPEAPDTGDSTNFHSEATAFFAALLVFREQLNALALGFGPGQPYCEVGGTANAITLDSGLNLSALVQGQIVRFRATSANTGATTINLDDLGATACRTVTGIALPAGYVRTDVDTIAVYDGTYWVLYREVEADTTSDTHWVKDADGGLTMWRIQDDTSNNWTAASGSFFMRGTSSANPYTWSLPIACVGTAAEDMYIEVNARRNNDNPCGAYTRNVTLTSIEVQAWSATSAASGTSKYLHMAVSGRWYE